MYSLVLELNEFIVNLLNIDIGPENIVVAMYGINDSIVETIKLLEKVKLLLDLE